MGEGSAKAGGGTPFYERRWFLGLAAVLGLVGAVAALVGPPKLWDVVADLFASELPAYNTEIVLDASAGMGEPFGVSRTKLDAAADAVGRFVAPFKNEGLALRSFGGECHEPGRLLVDFGEDHGDDVRAAAAEQQPRGNSNLAAAVIAAVDDFGDEDRFPDRDSPRRVVVFTGTVDECHPGNAAADILEEVEHKGVKAVFRFVGVKVSTSDRERLRAFEKDLSQDEDVDVSVTFADTREQLVRTIRSLVPDCADEMDNDGDGRVDQDDPGCAEDGTEADDRPAGECEDEMDNDGDERVDEDDPGCAEDETEADDQPAGECADGVDNDGDGLFDEDDPGCAEDGTEADDEPAGECADGVDNDGDGLVDEDDPGCAEDGTEADDEPAGECADGVDNDGDGRVDEEDSGCTDGTEAPVQEP